MVHRQVVQVPRQSDVILNHLAVACCSRLLQGEPDLERTKSTRVLRTDVVVVQALTLEVVVGGMIRERIPQSRRVANEGTSSLKGCVQPFVRIHGHGISRLQPLQFRGRARQAVCKCPVCAVDVEPEFVLLTERRQFRQRFDRAGTDGSRGADHEKWLIALVSVPPVADLQLIQVHASRPVDPMNRFGSQSGQISGFLYPGVSLRGSVDTQPRPTCHALPANIPTGLRGAGSQETGEIGHVAAAQEQDRRSRPGNR